MLRRYAPACLLIMAVSTGTAVIAHKASAAPRFTTACNFQVFVRAALVAQAPPTPEFLKFTASLALSEVQAATPTVYQQIAQSQHQTATAFAGNVVTTGAPGVGAFRVSVSGAQPQRPVQIANAVCDRYVTVIKKQRVDEIDSDIKVVQGRMKTIQTEIARLQKIPLKRRTVSDTAALTTQRLALNHNAQLIAAMSSLPPDRISVLKHAVIAQRSQSVNLSKYLIVAVVAGLLACFLLILVGEVVAESRGVSRESRRPAA